VRLSIKDHRFQPTEPRAPAGKPITIEIRNLDPTPAEFESKNLARRESGRRRRAITVQIRPLAAGRYRFFDDYTRHDRRLSWSCSEKTSMLGALIIVFREVIEAGIIVGILLAVTEGVPSRGRWIAAGIGAGVGGAALLAVLRNGSPMLWRHRPGTVQRRRSHQSPSSCWLGTTSGWRGMVVSLRRK